jgi:hypothetical protein
VETCCCSTVGIRAWTCSRYWFVKVGGRKFGREREVKLPRGGIGGMGGKAKEVRTRVRSTIRTRGGWEIGRVPPIGILFFLVLFVCDLFLLYFLLSLCLVSPSVV